MITRTADGKWAVVKDGAVVGTYDTNAAAWRALDRLENQPVSKREDTADWVWRKGIGA